MKITVHVPRILATYCEGEHELEVEGNTLGRVLADLQMRYPELYRCVCDETGKVRQHINLFVNDDLFTRNELGNRLKPDDVVSIFQSVSGG